MSERVSPRGDNRFIRPDERGRIKESDDVSRSLAGRPTQASQDDGENRQSDKGISDVAAAIAGESTGSGRKRSTI